MDSVIGSDDSVTLLQPANRLVIHDGGVFTRATYRTIRLRRRRF
jgi:hypothetical protein